MCSTALLRPLPLLRVRAQLFYPWGLGGKFNTHNPYHQQYLSKNPGGYCGIGGTGVSCPIGGLEEEGSRSIRRG